MLKRTDVDSTRQRGKKARLLYSSFLVLSTPLGGGWNWRDLQDLVLMEQLINSVSPELATFIKERQPANVTRGYPLGRDLC